MKNNESYVKGYLCSVFALALILCSTTAFADIIHVPGDQPTIQAGIDAASDGDTVLVTDGTYTGTWNKDLDFNGKAITVQSESGPENCIIDCERDGRGFFFHSGEGEDSVVSGFTITNGHKGGGAGAGGYGGGIYCKSSSPTISNCIITWNSVERGWIGGGYGGGIHCESSSATINNCTISNNTAEVFGGGIHCDSYSVTIANCTINDNTADFGGGVYCLAPSIVNCTIRFNTADHCGGGVYCSSSTITNSIVTRNKADRGGGIYCTASPTIINCTIAGNAASYMYGGGGIYCYYSFPTITNCILWRDAAGEIYVWGGNTPTVTYCDVEGGYPGTGNIDDDPSFADPENGDFHLQANSSCIDAGTNDAPEIPDTDFEGDSRIIDGDNDGTPTVDMGADEFRESCECDLNSDGRCDMEDWLLFGEDWGRTDCGTPPGSGNPPNDCECDLNHDGRCDMEDWLIFGEDWGRTDCPVYPGIEEYSNSGCLPGSAIDSPDDQYPWCGNDEIEAFAEGHGIHVTHRNARYNCCPDDIKVSMSVKGNLLRLSEEEILTHPCDCLCCYDIKTSIVGLLPGVYSLEYCWADYETGAECHIDEIVIP